MHATREEALQREGDEPAPADPPTLPEGWEAVGKGSEKVVTEEVAEPDAASDRPADAVAKDADAAVKDAAASASGTSELVVVGILAGVYLLYMIGWLIAGLRLRTLPLLPDFAYLVAMVLAIAAPALWFAASWLLTRRAKTWVRLAALLAGVVLLVPWPFVTFGWMGVAQ